MERKIIAIFGGSFNPPIISHINLAKQILKKMKNIEKVIFVPVSTKYRKEGLLEDEHRFNILKIICDKEKNLEVSKLELESSKRLYTIETLDFFKDKYKKNDIYFIMGTDNLKQIETWKNPEQILGNYKIIVLERGNDNLDEIIGSIDLLKNNEESIIRINDLEKYNLSSTMIRLKIKNGENVEEFIDKDVLEYIINNKLYK